MYLTNEETTDQTQKGRRYIDNTGLILEVPTGFWSTAPERSIIAQQEQHNTTVLLTG